MGDLQRIVVLCVVAAVIAVVAVWYQNTAFAPTPQDTQIDVSAMTAPSPEAVADFKFALEEAVRTTIGQPIEGYEPQMFLEVYPGLVPEDFDGVEAQIGYYQYVDGALRHEVGEVKLVHSAAPAVSEEGVATLLGNVRTRLVDAKTVEEVLEALAKDDSVTVEPEPIPEPVACTMDAKQCPDGSYVGRVGPNCEFAACPVGAPTEDGTVCTEAMRSAEACTLEYAPVCGLVEVQCFTTPCNPVPETFSNGCSACAQGNVTSYTPGACEM